MRRRDRLRPALDGLGAEHDQRGEPGTLPVVQPDRREAARHQIAGQRAQIQVDAVDAQHGRVHERTVGASE